MIPTVEMHHSWLGFVYQAYAAAVDWLLHSWGFWSDCIKVLFAAVIADPLVNIIAPLELTSVRVRFRVTTTPGKLAFSWDRQSFSVCHYPNVRLHRLLELKHRKQCRVVIEAGQKEFEDLRLGTHWFHIVQKGKRTITFEPVGQNPQLGAFPADAMNFTMYDFNPHSGQTIIITSHGQHRLRNPEIQDTSQEVEIR
jgi:hypothetical protein